MKKFLALLMAFALAFSTVSALAEAGEALTLPTTWKLESVYASVDEWMADYDKVMAMLDQYESYRGTLNTAQSIYDYFQFSRFTELTRLQEKLGLYAQLGSSLDATDPVFTELQAKLDAMDVKESQNMAFADPEIYALPLEEREAIFSDPLFDGYEYTFRNYVDPDRQPLGEEVSEALATVSMALGYGYKAFCDLIYAEIPYPVITMPDGTEQELRDAVYDDIVYSSEYSDEFKAEANQLVLMRVKPYVHTLAALLEQNAAEAYASALLNGYETTRECALDTYDVDPAVYDMLIEAAHNGAPDYQRFLRAHARALGLEEQYPYNMGTFASDFDPDKVAYEDGVAEVLDMVKVFGDEYVDTFKAIVTSGQVDVYPADNKDTGAFETQPSLEYLPWVLFNYNGESRDVSTIAHEMGHAVYQAFASKYQPGQYAWPTTFTHEVASTTNELLYYNYKMEHAADDDERLYYLENMIQTFTGTFFTQMWFAEFEDYIYQIVESGSALDPEDLGDKWDELNALYRGDAIKTFPDSRYQWSDIPHFYYVYYVYQYASSVAYAASLAERIASGADGAVDGYLAFLKLGDSADPQTLLSAAGIDPLSADTYQYALTWFSELVDEYERLVDARLAGAEAA